jgi:signal transduction histidine kinase
MMSSRALVLVGVITWLIIGFPSVRWELLNEHLLTPAGLSWLTCFVLFIVGFLVASRERCEKRLEWTMRMMQAFLALACIAWQPVGFQGILLVIVAGQLGHLRLVQIVAWIVIQTAALAVILFLNHVQVAFFIALAYFAFQLFGAFAAKIAHEEGVARRELAAANAELQVASGLLDMSSRTEERLRIARDLHDLIGHHLTALTLNLEVASHQTDGAAREQIDKGRSLAKLLLSDVRDVVSRLRENEPVDLAGALRGIAAAVPTPAVHLQVDDGLALSDPATGKAALRVVQEIVTNTVRHASAKNLWLSVTSEDGKLKIDARDDGVGTDDVRPAHGLLGMRERVEQLGGSLNLNSMRGRGFHVMVNIPLARAGA